MRAAPVSARRAASATEVSSSSQVGAAQPQGGGGFRTPGGGGRRGTPVLSYGRCPVLRRGRGRRPRLRRREGGELPHRRGPFDRLDRGVRAADVTRVSRRPSCPTDVAVSSSTPARLRSAPYAGTVAAFRASRSASGPLGGGAQRDARIGRASPAGRSASAVPRTPTHSAGPGVQHRSPGRPAAQPQRVPAGCADRQLQGVVEEMEAFRCRVRHGGRHRAPVPRASTRPAIRTYVPVATRSRTVTGSGSDAEPSVWTRARPRSGSAVTASAVDTHAGAVGCAVQDQPGQSVDRLVAGDHACRGGRPRSRCPGGARPGRDTRTRASSPTGGSAAASPSCASGAPAAGRWLAPGRAGPVPSWSTSPPNTEPASARVYFDGRRR